MSEQPYSVHVDLTARLLMISLRGFWTSEILDSFEAELSRAVAALERTDSGEKGFVALTDLREHPVQSQDVAHRLRSITERLGSKPRRIANLMSGGALQQMQARRIATDENSRDFTDEAEALAWLKAA